MALCFCDRRYNLFYVILVNLLEHPAGFFNQPAKIFINYETVLIEKFFLEETYYNVLNAFIS
ncbi:MAG: hypothetical protein CM1200mP10_31320 [Candidatus Neomarinimicrobiota bacterium]|nr:MAG: hypothetical protein CM1200mP10_31320 [Candidatus Neomarinimicrobiota bacterium]